MASKLLARESLDQRRCRGAEIPGGRVGTAGRKKSDAQMESGLLAVCNRPARECDVRNFQTLHNPRLHSMTEWILQYENARQRQDLYLEQMKDLRQQFSKGHKRNHPEPSTKPRRFWTPAWDPLMIYTSKKRNRRMYPSSETCVLFTKDRAPRHRLTRPVYWSGNYSIDVPTSTFHAARRTLADRNSSTTNESHRYINIVNNYNNKDGGKVGGGSTLPPIDAVSSKLVRHQTDYEPLERISRRNKLNLTSFFREGRAASQHSIDLSDVRVEATPVPRTVV